MQGVLIASPLLFATLLGVILALCQLPLPLGVLAPVALAGVLAHAVQGRAARDVNLRVFWAGFGYFALHLWWLTSFLAKIFQFPPAGVLALGLFAIEGAFLLVISGLVTRLYTTPAARVWGLAGGWVLLEWLRFLGPLAFPWPTLGYTLLRTPAIQIADLGGILLGSVLVAFLAAALAHLLLWTQWGRGRPLLLAALSLLAANLYGLTRHSGQGREGRALLQRTTIDSFAKASQQLSGQQQFNIYKGLTTAARQPGEVAVWTETAIFYPNEFLKQAPANGLYGSAGFFERANRVIAWDGKGITSQNDKARPVPFGEYFPLRGALNPLWQLIERAVGFGLESVPPANTMTPLQLNGVKYGAYVCYDSVFPWVARELTRKGAQVLVNVSNDGWYEGWGVQQHFNMGRVRAIESRRWLIRSVNEGVAAVVNDLGQPVQTLSTGQGVIHARYRLLEGKTLYDRFGDFPAVLLALLMIGYGFRLDRISRQW